MTQPPAEFDVVLECLAINLISHAEGQVMAVDAAERAILLDPERHARLLARVAELRAINQRFERSGDPG